MKLFIQVYCVPRFYRGITWLISSMRMGNYGAISVNVALPSSLSGAVTQAHLSE